MDLISRFQGIFVRGFSGNDKMVLRADRRIPRRAQTVRAALEFSARARRLTASAQRFIFKDLTFTVPAGRAAEPLDRVLREQHAGASWADVRRLIETGKVFVDGNLQRETSTRVSSGAQIELRMATARQRAGPRLPAQAIVHVDAHVVVVQKPAGISTVPEQSRRARSMSSCAPGSVGVKRRARHRAPHRQRDVGPRARTL